MVDQIKNFRAIGMKYVAGNGKSRKLASQFWLIWREFGENLSQELNHQHNSALSIIKKKISAFNNSLDLFQADDIQESVDEVNQQIFSVLKSATGESVSEVIKYVKGLCVLIKNRSPEKYQLNAILSQIISQLKNLRDVISAHDKILVSINNDTIVFKSLIPDQVDNESNNKEQDYDKGLSNNINREFSLANEINRKSKNKPNSKLDALVQENNSLKEQLDSLQKTKLTKRTELDAKKSREFQELSNLKSKILKLTQKSKMLAAQKLERNTHSCSSINPLSSLQSEIRDLEKEQIQFNAMNDHLIKYLDKKGSSKILNRIDIYKQNMDLRKKQNDLNLELFNLSTRCIQLNKILQKAASRTFDLKGDQNNIKKEFAMALGMNQDLNEKIENMNNELMSMQNNSNKTIYNYYYKSITFPGKNISSFNDQSNSSSNIQHQFEKLKELVHLRKTDIYEQQKNDQINFTLACRKATDNSLMALRSDTKNDIDDIRSQLEEVKETYKNLTKNYNKASLSNEEFIYIHDDIEIGRKKRISIEDAEREIRNLLNKFNELNQTIATTCIGEAQKETKILKNEIYQLTQANSKVLSMINYIKKQSILFQSSLQANSVCYKVLVNKNESNANDRIEEEIKYATNQNSVLKKMLDNTIANLKNLHIDYPK